MYTSTPLSSGALPTRALLTATLLGAVAGALFGAGFGAFASVFHNGPELWTGVRESWGFFAVLGAAMGLSWAWAHRRQPDTASDA